MLGISVGWVFNPPHKETSKQSHFRRKGYTTFINPYGNILFYAYFITWCVENSTLQKRKSS